MDYSNHFTRSCGFGILLPKLFWPTVRKNCSSDREKLLKFEAEGREFEKVLRSLEQWNVRTISNLNTILHFTVTIQMQIGTNNW